MNKIHQFRHECQLAYDRIVAFYAQNYADGDNFINGPLKNLFNVLKEQNPSIKNCATISSIFTWLLNEREIWEDSEAGQLGLIPEDDYEDIDLFIYEAAVAGDEFYKGIFTEAA